MDYNEYRLKQYVKKTKETVSDEKDGFLRKRLRNLFYRVYPHQSLFNKNVAHSLVEIMAFIENNKEKPNTINNDNPAKEKQIWDTHETQIEDLRTQIIQLQREIETLKSQQAGKQTPPDSNKGATVK